MAAKKTAAHLVPYQFKPAHAAAPIVIRETRTIQSKGKGKGKGKGRRHHAGSLTSNHLIAIVLGGYVAGFLEKQFASQLPSIPLLGRKGTLTIALYFAAKNFRIGGDLIKNACIASAGISGYELGTTGKISGVDVEGIASQV